MGLKSDLVLLWTEPLANGTKSPSMSPAHEALEAAREGLAFSSHLRLRATCRTLELETKSVFDGRKTGTAPVTGTVRSKPSVASLPPAVPN
jgi:hypothetical protein